MLIEKINLWKHKKDVNLTGYILENSKEFNKDKKRTTIIICPGGSYVFTSDREAEPVAMRFASKGYNTFVLRYSTLNTGDSVFPEPLYDLAKSIKIVRENAEKWNIDRDNIVLCGFSAGGHLVASLGVHWHDDFLKEKLGCENEMLKPNGLILAYPFLDCKVMKEKIEEFNDEYVVKTFEKCNTAIFGTANPTDIQIEELTTVNYVSEKTPPTFIWHTAEDGLIYVENSLNFARALSRYKVPYDLHIFSKGQHGLSLCDETTARDEKQINEHCSKWVDLALTWLNIKNY